MCNFKHILLFFLFLKIIYLYVCMCLESEKDIKIDLIIKSKRLYIFFTYQFGVKMDIELQKLDGWYFFIIFKLQQLEYKKIENYTFKKQD